MVERRQSVVTTFDDSDYTRLRRLGYLVRGLGIYAVVMGLWLVTDIVRSIGQPGTGTGVSLAVIIVIAIVWFGFALFAFLVSRDAIDATDTHVVLEVSAAIGVVVAITFAHLVGMIPIGRVISQNSWKAITFSGGWVAGYAIYCWLGGHLRRRFGLKRGLSPPPTWIVFLFSVTVWVAGTALMEDLVSAAIGGDWRGSPLLFAVIVTPPVILGIATYLALDKKLHSEADDESPIEEREVGQTNPVGE